MPLRRLFSTLGTSVSSKLLCSAVGRSSVVGSWKKDLGCHFSFQQWGQHAQMALGNARLMPRTKTFARVRQRTKQARGEWGPFRALPLLPPCHLPMHKPPKQQSQRQAQDHRELGAVASPASQQHLCARGQFVHESAGGSLHSHNGRIAGERRVPCELKAGFGH